MKTVALLVIFVLHNFWLGQSRDLEPLLYIDQRETYVCKKTSAIFIVPFDQESSPQNEFLIECVI